MTLQAETAVPLQAGEPGWTERTPPAQGPRAGPPQRGPELAQQPEQRSEPKQEPKQEPEPQHRLEMHLVRQPQEWRPGGWCCPPDRENR